MRVVHIQCGAYVNASEERAFKAVEGQLQRVESDQTAFILTNLSHASSKAQPDEIDQVVLGPGGAVVIEVKHWDRARLKDEWEVDPHVELIARKAKQVAGRLRTVVPSLGFVPPAILLTKDTQSLRKNGKLPERPGIRFYGLKDLDALLSDVAQGTLSTDVLERMSRSLAPRQVEASSITPKRLARFDDLKLLSPVDDRFARVYSGRDPANGDRVIIHSYDLSAAPSILTNPENLARREFDAVQKLQKSPFLPSLVDSWQAIPNYPGEMFFFTLAESGATKVRELASDPAWTVADRLVFAVRALRALAQLQPVTDSGETVIHRDLNTDTVRIRADGAPLFAGWRWARLPSLQTIASERAPVAGDEFAAPELRTQGLGAARPESDIYSLCKTLLTTAPHDGEAAGGLRSALALGLEEDPTKRAAPNDIADLIETCIPAPILEAGATPGPERWDEGFVFPWENHKYRVVSLLGQGGAGRTFKLEEIEGETGDPIGTYVGKVVINAALGPPSLKAYRKIRSIADHPSLSSVLHTSADWRSDTLIALLRWRRGEPLDAWKGDDLRLLSEIVGESDPEAMLVRWAVQLCEALEVLHSQGWVHGDVSPSNILVDEGDALLIDYDLAGPIGAVTATPGTVPYASPERLRNEPVQPVDDLFSLAASLFYAITGRLPIASAGSPAGLAWTEGERERWPFIAEFIETATNPIRSRRFETGGAAARMLRANLLDEVSESIPISEPHRLTPNVVPRVREILSTYPGSRFGNTETRGLDSVFAHDTYVETGLDSRLLGAIKAGEVSLVILCGNAGDGKTAFLQHIANSLGASSLLSSERVWKGKLHGREIKINLDGAAAWKGHTADDLLDDLFAPFQNGANKEGRAHLVAVNDGRLMEWIESYETRHGNQTKLTQQLTDALGHGGSVLDDHIELIELNLRSLVGGLNEEQGHVTSEFVDRLIDKLVGGTGALEIWRPCLSCTAQARCPMWRSAEIMGASIDPIVLAQGKLLRRRLTTALQAVHQRNEVHITARELKAALSYILFGLYDCTDLHERSDLQQGSAADRAFDPTSQLRQGELLRELTRLDPALDAHPRVDRYLAGHGVPAMEHGAPRYPNLTLRKARRNAWFNWSDHQIQMVGGEPDALGLKDGRRFSQFRDFPLLPELERHQIRDALCSGLARLESLPDIAFTTSGMLPIGVVPRTPTETAFWVGKPLDRFKLEAEHFTAPRGLDTLHRQLILSYQTTDGRLERLTISLELYSLLMALAGGVQILDAFSDDVFANLGVFTQRLAQEDERSLYAWNPSDEEAVHKISIQDASGRQAIVLTSESSL